MSMLIYFVNSALLKNCAAVAVGRRRPSGEAPERKFAKTLDQV